MLFNYALSAAQIKVLYNQNAAVRFAPTPWARSRIPRQLRCPGLLPARQDHRSHVRRKDFIARPFLTCVLTRRCAAGRVGSERPRNGPTLGPPIPLPGSLALAIQLVAAAGSRVPNAAKRRRRFHRTGRGRCGVDNDPARERLGDHWPTAASVLHGTFPVRAVHHPDQSFFGARTVGATTSPDLRPLATRADQLGMTPSWRSTASASSSPHSLTTLPSATYTTLMPPHRTPARWAGFQATLRCACRWRPSGIPRYRPGSTCSSAKCASGIPARKPVRNSLKSAAPFIVAGSSG
jgi:hypothetical protein